MSRNPTFYPFLVTVLAIGLLSLMDGFMKSAALAVGAYSALLLRSGMALAMVGPVWLWQGAQRPGRKAMRLHLLRGVIIAFTALTFFSALVYLPLAEAIALSFISPLMALALAALVLKEKIAGKTLAAAVLGLAGVVIIVGGRIGRERLTDEAALGIVLVLVSAVLYAWNLILQRQQALLAKPVEIATFQSMIVGATLLLAAPFFFILPEAPRTWLDIGMTAVLSLIGGMLLAWAYARAEAQVLVPVEYTGFAWAALFGWLLFAEVVQWATLAGAALIIVGCWIAAPRKHTEQTATGVASVPPVNAP
ncbi:DMT family transporter [Alteraurantiacibacter aquimixticola]|uniref:DMT family transporter n=1 Tax=Alteraurantiacibacter aquimixticola TaxID=2489173 RepID=A0A4T3F7V6_9SPHN|nr:DMT family transporter [Alteraurantiacibacter aquimixticola]TIX51080.1 DMT family transporter [Alteraurantiacibacter aquimixticola]